MASLALILYITSSIYLPIAEPLTANSINSFAGDDSKVRISFQVKYYFPHRTAAMCCCFSDDDRSFDYLFYIDFEASMAELRAQHALGHLQVSELFIAGLSSLFNRFFDLVFLFFYRNSRVSSVYSGVIPWI